jgi:ribosome biogenesis protein ERB1
MAVTGLGKVRNKRKQEEVEEVEKGPFADAVDLEMQSEDEAEDEDREEDDASDGGNVDAFPEIDAASDSDEESDEEEEEEDTDDLDEDDTLGENSDADSDLHLFPKSKRVVSDITGQTKVVYPEIEPDYDSDSSTEDVSRI